MLLQSRTCSLLTYKQVMCLKFKKQMNRTSSVHPALLHTPEQNVLRTETVSLLTHWDLGIICLCNQSQGSVKVVRKNGKLITAFTHQEDTCTPVKIWCCLTNTTHTGGFFQHAWKTPIKTVRVWAGCGRFQTVMHLLSFHKLVVSWMHSQTTVVLFLFWKLS